ncbi:MAG: hypothetical protein ACYSWU_20850, partial [Planctomycetota bacterium]
EYWLKHCHREYAEYLVRGDLVTNLMLDFYDADMSLTPSSPSATLKRELMEGVLARMARVARASDVPLALLVVPSSRDVCPDYDYGRVDSARYPGHRPSAMTDVLEEIAVRLGIPSFSLLEPFQERGGCSLYFRGKEDHWNDAAQSLAGELVAESLVSMGTLK